MNFDQRKSSANWAKVDWDRSIWFPIPTSFTETKYADAAEWAFDWAGDRVLRAHGELTKKLVKKEVLPFSQALVLGRHETIGKISAHKFYFHCPDAKKSPVLTSIGLWKTQGSREEAFQYYSYFGTKTATEQPVAEWFDTEMLGRGVKAQWSGVTGPGKYWQVNYAFRDEEYETDVHVWMMEWDHKRFLEVVPDLDTLVRTIRCIPDPANTVPQQ